jgi:hypothetical protein
MPPVASPYQCLAPSFLLISSLILLSYFFAQFPHAPQGYSVHPSLASLGPETKAKDIYPEDYYAGGAYVSLPFGNVRPLPHRTAFLYPHRAPCVFQVRYWLLGPEAGEKVANHLFPIFLFCVTHRAQIVLIHGLSIPSLIWKDVAPTLASRGYRVLLYGKRDRVLISVPQLNCRRRSLRPRVFRCSRNYL